MRKNGLQAFEEERGDPGIGLVHIDIPRRWIIISFLPAMPEQPGPLSYKSKPSPAHPLPLPQGHDASLHLHRCLQSGNPHTHPPHPSRSHTFPNSSPTSSSTGASQIPPSESWPSYSRSRRFGPSSFSPTLPPHSQPSSSPSSPTFLSSHSPSHPIVSPRSTLSHPSQAQPSASSQSGGESGKHTRAAITCVSMSSTRNTVQSSESVRTSCLLPMSLPFPPFWAPRVYPRVIVCLVSFVPHHIIA